MVLITTLKDFFYHLHICTMRVMCMCVICKQTLNVHVFPFTYTSHVDMYGTEFDDNVMFFGCRVDKLLSYL